jgi:hypothetical protein
MAVVKIRIHRAPIFELLYAPTGDVHNLVERTTNAVQIAVLRETPFMTGDMLASIGKDIRVAPGRSVRGIVESDDEAALWVQQGTGVFGPQGRPITSTRPGGRLRWPNRNPGRGRPGEGPFVDRRSVAGQEANPFMWRGLVRGTSVGPQRWTLNRLI